MPAWRSNRHDHEACNSTRQESFWRERLSLDHLGQVSAASADLPASGDAVGTVGNLAFPSLAVPIAQRLCPGSQATGTAAATGDSAQPRRAGRRNADSLFGRRTRKALLGYLFGYSGDANHRYLWYDFRPRRNRDGPREVLRDFRGVLQTDGFSGYESLVSQSQGRLTAAACWMHARRGFDEARYTASHVIIEETLARIGLLYDIEEHAQGLSSEDRAALRMTDSRGLVERLFARWQEVRPELRPSSKLAQAIDYVLHRQAELSRFLNDGRIELDTGHLERSLRGPAIGRRNWLFFGSFSGGQTAATLYSVVQSARLHHLDVTAYLTGVLRRLPALMPTDASAIGELLPDCWAQRTLSIYLPPELKNRAKLLICAESVGQPGGRSHEHDGESRKRLHGGQNSCGVSLNPTPWITEPIAYAVPRAPATYHVSRVVALSLPLLLFICRACIADEPTTNEQPANGDQRLQSTIKSAADAVIRVRFPSKQATSGLIVSDEGYVVWPGSAHPRSDIAVVLASGESVPAINLGWSMEWRVGLLKLVGDRKWPHAELGTTAQSKSGDQIFEIGYRAKQGEDGQFDLVTRIGKLTLVSPSHWFATNLKPTPFEYGSATFDTDGKLLGLSVPGTSEVHHLSTASEIISRIGRN